MFYNCRALAGGRSTHPSSEMCAGEGGGLNESRRIDSFCAQGTAQNSQGISPARFQWSRFTVTLSPAVFKRQLLCHISPAQDSESGPSDAPSCWLCVALCAPALAPLSCPTTLSPVLSTRSCTSAREEFLQRQTKSRNLSKWDEALAYL